MIAKAYARYIRVSPRKVRQVVDLLRGKSVYEALSILANLNKRAAVFAEDILRSAMSNAKRNPEVKEENLYISKMVVDGGPMLKRFRAASMGRASMIRHRLSHIGVELDLVPARVAEDGRQKTENRGRKTENGRRKTEDGKQRTEDRKKRKKR